MRVTRTTSLVFQLLSSILCDYLVADAAAAEAFAVVVTGFVALAVVAAAAEALAVVAAAAVTFAVVLAAVAVGVAVLSHPATKAARRTTADAAAIILVNFLFILFRSLLLTKFAFRMMPD